MSSRGSKPPAAQAGSINKKAAKQKLGQTSAASNVEDSNNLPIVQNQFFINYYNNASG